VSLHTDPADSVKGGSRVWFEPIHRGGIAGSGRKAYSHMSNGRKVVHFKQSGAGFCHAKCYVFRSADNVPTPAK